MNSDSLINDKINRASERDLEKFTGVYMDYYPLIMGAAIKRAANRDEAEDICQEVFSILLEKINEVHDHKSWLMGTLKLVTLRHYQALNRDTADIEAHFDDANLGYVNGFRDTRIMIAEAMDAAECTPDDRTLLDLVAVRGFTYENAAKAVGLSRRQARYRYERIVERIIEKLRRKGVNDLRELL